MVNNDKNKLSYSELFAGYHSNLFESNLIFFFFTKNNKKETLSYTHDLSYKIDDIFNKINKWAKHQTNNI